MHFIDLERQQAEIKSKIDINIAKVLKEGKYILGPEVREIEEKLANYTGSRYAIGVSNGTDALLLALMAIGVKKGDAVFLPSFTFFATAEAVSFLGATPIFVDIDEVTFNISVSDLENKIEDINRGGRLKPKAVMPVDIFGLPADYPEIEKLAKKYDLKIVEDSAQSFGGKIGDKICCSFGDIATTSFFPAKPLGCYGDGGMVFTDCEDYYQKIISLRVHGQGKDKYDNITVGMNARLDTIQAAILLAKFEIFEDEVKRRGEIAEIYNQLLKGHVITPTVPKNYRSSFAQYTIRVKDRDKVIAHFKSKNIPTAIYYSMPLHKQKAYKSDNNLYLPVTERVCKDVMSLPFHPYQKPEEQEFIAKSIIEVLD